MEEIENIIYNLTNNIDIINTNKRIEQYKRENREIIMKNKSRLGREEYELELVLEQEKAEDEQRRIEREAIENDAKKKKAKEKEALIDELMFSNGDASRIVEDYAKQVEKLSEEAKVLPVVKPQTEFSTGVKFGQQAQFLPVPKLEEGPLYVYESPTITVNGPLPPDMNDVECKGFTRHVRWVDLHSNQICENCNKLFLFLSSVCRPETAAERAGGYKCGLACQRALTEAMQGLFFSNT